MIIYLFRRICVGLLPRKVPKTLTSLDSRSKLTPVIFFFFLNVLKFNKFLFLLNNKIFLSLCLIFLIKLFRFFALQGIKFIGVKNEFTLFRKILMSLVLLFHVLVFHLCQQIATKTFFLSLVGLSYLSIIKAHNLFSFHLIHLEFG